MQTNTRQGILYMIATTMVFAMQDGISRYLAAEYNVMMVVMIRYWFFAAFVIALASRKKGAMRAAIATSQPMAQTCRSILLVIEICIMVAGFTYLGLVESHAIFAACPFLVAALSGPILGERVGWRRWSAIGVGFFGVLIILQPGSSVFAPAALLPLVAAAIFALCSVLTRYVARKDSATTTFFWTGVSGAIAMTLVGIFFWEAMAPADWGWMGALCIAGVLAQFFLIKAYEMAEASAIQPLAYLQLLFTSCIGMLVFDETLRANVAIGGTVVVTAGLFTLWRNRVQSQRDAKI